MSTGSGIPKISNSVGRGGKNLRKDVLAVQELVNVRLPIPLRPLDVSGFCDAFTIGAIEEIQRRELHMSPADGRVDPRGATLQYLVTGIAPKPSHGGGTFPADVIAAAQASQKTWNIPAAITLAQWAIESGYGKSMPSGSNNPFGIKAAEGEPFVEASTREVIKGKDITIKAKFRKFTSLTEAFDLHGKLLATGKPYAHARTLISDPDAFADALTGVYATDPTYGTVLKRIMKAGNLYQYD
jgi:hypothetical protein